MAELGPASEIGLQPVEWCLRHSKLKPQAIKKKPMFNGVKDHRQVKADQDSDFLVIGRREGIVQDFQ